jgi:endonuclease/exonuclease/phosphatase family metal-dependent hydrolase
MVTVLTRNLFLGADLRPVYAALADPERLADVPGIVADIFNPDPPRGMVQRTDFPARVRAIAGEIEAARPDLIGLQEAAVWRMREQGSPIQPVVADHLEMLEMELASRRLAYRRVAVATNGVVELGSAAGRSVGLTDRDAILARAGLALSHARTGHFFSAVRVRTARGEYFLKRGWASVDAQLRGETIRFVTTHLEAGTPPDARTVQTLQMGQLLGGPARTPLPVVMAGDFNARPGSPTYELARAGGFEDAWTRAHPGGPPGATCCHALLLDDPSDELRSRIDLILTRGEIDVASAAIVGDFTAGRWPSDHAGVVATLERAA